MSRCYMPIQLPNKANPDILLTVPCGQCIGCRLNRSENWASRMMHEAQLHETNSFVTLTYSDDNLPINGSLAPDDVTLFFKRLRKKLGAKKIKYYYCGEYGEKYERPHYHIALFNHDFSSDRVPHRITDMGTTYRSEILEALWDKGHSEIDNLTYESARYVASYIQKKINGYRQETHYSRVTDAGEVITLTPEFARMSRRPAIGREWLEKYIDDVYNYDLCVVGEKKLRVPQYYDKLLAKIDPIRYDLIKMEREASMSSTSDVTDLDQYYAKAMALKSRSRSLEGSAPDYDSERLNFIKELKNHQHKLNKEN